MLITDLNPSDFKELVERCLYNWLGYGNVNSPVWFMGMEEGGAEIWRQKTKTLEQSLSIRSSFNVSMDFQHVWEELYHIPLESFKGANVWRYMAAFMLSIEGVELTTERIRSFIYEQKKLGQLGSNHFLCEYLPLPRQTNASIDDYRLIWKTNKDYINEVGPKRFEFIKSTLLENADVKLLVSYDWKFSLEFKKHFHCELKQKWQDDRNKDYELYRTMLSNERELWLLTTPFFGQGQASYDGLKTAAENIKRLSII